MSNDYYVTPADERPLTTVRSAVWNGNNASVEAGFDKLPTEQDIKRVQYGADVSASAALYQVTIPYLTGPYFEGLAVEFKAVFENTGPANISVNGGTNEAIVDTQGSTIVAGSIKAGQIIRVVRNPGSGFQLTSTSALAQDIQDAKDAADASAISASAAAISETNAANSEAGVAADASAAAISETNASAAASAAATSETNASGSASAAATSETNASGSASAAATSETNASGSASAAATSETNASVSETNASGSASAAATSETNASVSETNAAASEAAVLGQFRLAVGNLRKPLSELILKNSLDFTGVGSPTFTRSTTGTCIDRYGVVQSAAIDAPRFEKEGLLLEGPSVNDFIRSEEFDNAAWVKNGLTVTPNAITAPDGALTADKTVEDTATTNRTLSQVISFTSGQKTTIGSFAKKGERDVLQLLVNPAASSQFANFDLTNGVVGTSTADNAVMIPLANDWFLCVATITSIATTSTTAFVSSTLLPTSPRALSFLGDGVSGLYLWGAQIEALPFHTSYIPTTTAPVARAIDKLSLSQQDNLPVIAGEGGAFVVDFTVVNSLAGTSSDRTLIRNPSANALLAIRDTVDNRLHYFLGGSSTIVDGVMNVGTPMRATCVYDANVTTTSYLDGVAVATEAVSGGTPINPAQTLFIGSINGTTGPLYAHISRVAFYTKPLTDTEATIV